jgi:putative ABC transport system ATP-binding protein
MGDAKPRAPILATEGVALSRGGKAVADLPDLAVHAGEVVAILGPSGAGKSTALLALAGIRPPDKGTIDVAGTLLWSLSNAGRDRFRASRIGLVFQSFHLIDALDVATNITLAASCAGHPVKPARLADLLDRLNIAELRRRRVDLISHGQAQRVAVARALYNKPALVLADEPTSALDDAATTMLLGLLRESAANDGAALVIATHDRRVIEQVDRVIELSAMQ